LVIAKLVRLSRNAAFHLTLRDSGVRFVAVDMPEANDLTVRIMALVVPYSPTAAPSPRPYPSRSQFCRNGPKQRVPSSPDIREYRRKVRRSGYCDDTLTEAFGPFLPVVLGCA
jgi:hypothetical protein